MIKALTALTLVAILAIGAWWLLSHDVPKATLDDAEAPATARQADKSSNEDVTGAGAKIRQTVTIPVDGVVCMACVANVRRNLARLEGVEEVDVSLAERRATVRFVEGLVTPAEIVERVRETGFQPGEPEPVES